MTDSMARGRISLFVIVGVMVAGLAGGWLYWHFIGQYREKTDNAYVVADISVISPKVQGYISDLPVGENQPVKAGDPLARIQPDDYQAALTQAQAAAASAAQSLALQQSVIHQAEAMVTSARAEQTRASRDADRYRELVRQAFASRQKMDSALADAARATAQLTQAQAALETERNRVSVLQAQKQQADAKLESAKLDLENTVIRAPIDGVVGNRTAQAGQYVRPGQQLMSVVPLASAYIVANYKETQLEHMKPGQAVTLKFDAFPGQEITGRLESFSPGTGSRWSLLPPENATGNFTKIVQRVPVRISIPQKNPLSGKIRPGLSVVATVHTDSVADQDRPTGAMTRPAP